MDKRFIRTTLFWALATLAFIGLSLSATLVAAGYKFDTVTFTLQRTGLLYLSGQPRAVTITVNGNTLGGGLPLKLSSLLPGDYDVEIAKDGYQTWAKSYRLGPGEARVETSIRLFLTEPERSVVTDPEVVKRVQNNTAASSLLHDKEISYQNELVTRVSGELKAAVLAADRGHVFFQVDKELRVIEIDGQNEEVLMHLADSAPSHLMLGENDKELLLLDGGQVVRLKVR